MPLQLEKLKILIVDDIENFRSLLKGYLHAFNITNLYEAKEGSEALAFLQKSEVDLIFMDWHMQPMDGLQATLKIREGATKALPTIPIVMTSAHTDRNHINAARNAGINEFLPKPINPTTVYAALRLIVENPRPFIRTPTYFGPDRRRKKMDIKGEERRKFDPFKQKNIK